jgi:spermidine synthase
LEVRIEEWKMEIYKDNLLVEMYSEHEGHLHGYKQVLVREETRCQQVEIVDTYEFGRCLFLDGKMQSSQVDEYLYHEFLVHPAMVTHPEPKQALIIGGGEGATLRELVAWHQGAFDDPRVRIIVDDGRKFIQDSREIYDIIIIDVSDPTCEGPASMLYTLQFYQSVAARLKPAGIMSLQAGTSSIVGGEIMASLYKTLQRVFPVVRAYEANIPSFDMPWGFGLAAAQLDPKQLNAQEIDRRLQLRGLENLRAYDGETHIGLFSPTKSLRNMLESRGRIIEDTQPIYTPL